MTKLYKFSIVVLESLLSLYALNLTYNTLHKLYSPKRKRNICMKTFIVLEIIG